MKPLRELLNLTGKAAIVTGGAKGIGKSIAYRLTEAGAGVLVADLDIQAAEQTAQELTQHGWKAAALQVDVSSENDVQGMVDACQEQFGSVNILVNNAGIYPPKPLAQMSEAEFEKVMHVNLRSAFLATRYAAEAMKQGGKGGRIINITSIDALHPSMIGLAHYDASKHGLWGFTKSSALELAHDNIWVNAVAPGGIMTPGVVALQASGSAPAADAAKAAEAFMAKIPMHRMGEPDEIGTVVLFLASDMAGYMTGSQIVVDGGALLA